MYQVESMVPPHIALRKLRLDECLTQAELAKRTTIDRTTISYLENNFWQPSPIVASKLSKYFGVPITTFLPSMNYQN